MIGACEDPCFTDATCPDSEINALRLALAASRMYAEWVLDTEARNRDSNSSGWPGTWIAQPGSDPIMATSPVD
jgi:hypothetical protein